MTVMGVLSTQNLQQRASGRKLSCPKISTGNDLRYTPLQMSESIYYSSGSRSSRPGIRLAMGFFFGIVAGLVFKDFIVHSYAIMDKYPNLQNASFVLAAGVFLMLQLLDGYLYYQYFEFSPLVQGPICWGTYCS
jgi:hypothetical protein